MPDKLTLARRVSLVCIVGNIILCLFKLAAGIVASSGAMISDAVHSASDVLSTGIALIGVKLGAKDADAEHPYGHDRFEAIASIILACILVVTGGLIGINAVKSILSAGNAELAAPGILALVAAVVSIVVKEWMYRYTMRAARKLNSVALKASAWDHRSDAFSSIGAFVGILGARLGVPILDPIASLVICVFILKAAVDIFREAVSQTVDSSCSAELTDLFRTVVQGQEGVLCVDLLRTRKFGAGVYVDVELSADGSLPLTEAHEIAERVHAAVEAAEPTVRHCMVHVNPDEGPTEEKIVENDVINTKSFENPIDN